MTNPHAVSRRRPTRARPRLPRGPKPPKPMAGRAAVPQPDEQASPTSPPPAPPQDESSTRHSSGPPKAFDRNAVKTIPVKEAAFRLNKSEDTVYSWLRVGRLRGWQLGGRRCSVLVSEESVERALRRAGEIQSTSRAAHSP